MTPQLDTAGAELVRSRSRLQHLEDDWRRLAVGRTNAFLTPEWFHCWWRHYGAGHEPLVGVVHSQDGQLRGVMPLVAGKGRPRTIRFAGSALGDDFHPAAATDDEAAVGAATARLLRATRVP